VSDKHNVVLVKTR